MDSSSGSTQQIGLADNIGSTQELYRFKPFEFQNVIYKPGIRPVGRTRHRIVSNNNEVYCFGGCNTDVSRPFGRDYGVPINSPLRRELWKFNMAKRQWKQIPATNLPISLVFNVVLLERNMLLVYGGIGIHRYVSKNLFICNLEEEIPSFREIHLWGDAPKEGFGQASFIHNGYLYVFGVTTGNTYNCDVHRLKLSTSEWEAIYISAGLPEDPDGRFHHELGLLWEESKIIVVGGSTVHTPYGFEIIHIFDLEKKQWSTVVTRGDPEITINSGYPPNRRYHTLAQVTGMKDIFITAGVSESGALSDSWKLNLDTLQWKKMHSLELDTPLQFHGSTVTPEGKLCIFSGKNQYIHTAKMWTAWLRIPKLQEICWEAVLFYKLLNRLPWDRVQQIIPPEFSNRLK